MKKLFHTVLLARYMKNTHAPSVALKMFSQRVEAFTLPSSVNNFIEATFKDRAVLCTEQKLAQNAARQKRKV